MKGGQVKMKNNKAGLFGVILIVLAVLIAGGFVLYYTNLDVPIDVSSDNGRIVVSMTDAAANMQQVSEVRVSVDSVEAHSESEGWVTLSSEQKTYDLLELKANNRNAVLADAELESGSYNQIRMHISEVVVVDAEGEHEAKLPSNTLRVNANFESRVNETASAEFDFIADESLHVTGNGMYILAPVVQVETRNNASVNVESDSSVIINGGSIESDSRVGMDINGNVGVGISVPSNTNISIGSDDEISISSNSNINAGLQ